MHKECFEPVIEHLFDMLGKGSVKVMEAWAIDCIQHGEAGVLNEEILKTTLLESCWFVLSLALNTCLLEPWLHFIYLKFNPAYMVLRSVAF